MKRRTFMTAMAAMGAQAAAFESRAAGFPERPITLIVPYAAGGNGDYTARAFGESLARVLKQPIVVENRAGGGGAIGASYVANAKADGYTLIVAAKGVFSITPNIVKVNYTIDDFMPVSFVSETPMVLEVRKNSPIKSLADLVAKAKEKPGALSAGIGAIGSDNHVAQLQFELATGTSFNSVAYKGAAPMLLDLLGGQIDVGVDQLTTSKSHIEAGELRPLAVLGLHPEPSLPSVPTIASIGAQPFDATTYIGVLAPRGTPGPAVAVLKKAMRQALQDPGLNERFAKSGGAVYVGEDGQFEKLVQAESDFIQRMIAQGKVKKEG
ncbi:tripartite tricarboxylate transporter substrate binding protein [Pigmentiphaga soli]|uniref:Tripartite tricarboxylate transporter substrate binding protein n=1 Tax=Pigmentiphaga soli TaxID=1007095 RepID=A0ABP8GEK0_9BURK